MRPGQTSEQTLRKALRKQGGWTMEPHGVRVLLVSREGSPLPPYRLYVTKGSIQLRDVEHMVRSYYGQPGLLTGLPWSFRKKK